MRSDTEGIEALDDARKGTFHHLEKEIDQ